MEELPNLDDMSMWQLVQILLAVACAMSRRMGMEPQAAAAAAAAAPPPGFLQQPRAQPRGHEAFDQPPACRGLCCICGRPCVRLEPGHKHCKCQPHLRTR